MSTLAERLAKAEEHLEFTRNRMVEAFEAKERIRLEAEQAAVNADYRHRVAADAFHVARDRVDRLKREETVATVEGLMEGVRTGRSVLPNHLVLGGRR